MNSVYLRLLAFSLVVSLTACDSKSTASMNSSVNVLVPAEVSGSIDPGEKTSSFQLNVNETVLEGLKATIDEPFTLSDSVELKIKPVKDEQRLSVSGRLLLQDTWQANYLDNIVGGKVELQLRFDD
jgi:hypothetical protein